MTYELLILFTDIYFFFCGWHLLFSVYMIIGIPGTGTAGLITTIIAFKHGHIVAGILSVIACTGWILQTVGNGIYYQKVRLHRKFQY
jgi:secretory carrier-associated membrane protein